MVKKIVFLTGTRADFGKLRSLIDALEQHREFEVHVFVTGMHMLRRYGLTSREVEYRNYRNIYKFINQNYDDTMDAVLGKTILGLSDYVKEIQPDMIVVHGDRVETLAGASVGCLNNVLVAHIEGGEVSGTVDEVIRHSVSKLAHLHFVSNDKARRRLIQLGEKDSSIYVIGSPDVDAMFDPNLPDLAEVKRWYSIPFQEYGIILYHPVTTEGASIKSQVKQLLDAAKSIGDNYVVIYPNNDSGSDDIISAYRDLNAEDSRFRVFPSMRFDYFLTLMKNSSYLLGNSSSALMEAPYYGTPAVNVGTRQTNRAVLPSVINCGYGANEIRCAIEVARAMQVEPIQCFGKGGSNQKFIDIVSNPDFWRTDKQKSFVDLEQM